MKIPFEHPYPIDPKFKKKIAYFCMEYGIHQPLKIYAGGLGYLSGSHMRSAFDLKQNILGIGILWKYGYYDQVRKQDQTMNVSFEEKSYGFLIETGLKFSILVNDHEVWVTAFYLDPIIFGTAPIFLLSTDLPENDYLAQTISHKLYDSNPETNIAASILLGVGGAKLLELLQWQPDIYHLNESHGLSLAFYLYEQYKNLLTLKQHLVFTNHTPEEAGNKKTNITLLQKLGFFCSIPLTEIRSITHSEDNVLNHTLAALYLSKIANGVSSMHRRTLLSMWHSHIGICEITSITNAQNFKYWHDPMLYECLKNNQGENIRTLKHQYKKELFEWVADQCGEIYDEKICTLVFAKRFAGYKRPDLFFHNMDRFEKLVTNKKYPVQIIWAGKPYPMDYGGIGIFDKIVNICKQHKNCSILVGYEMKLSRLLKKGSDIWLNVPRLSHEASGTSGMSAAMNGSINVALPDGWFPEFAKDKINSFVIPPCDTELNDDLQDDLDAESLYDLLENEIIPLYYDFPGRWLEIIKSAMNDISPSFDSNRMAIEYYEQLYNSPLH